MAGSGGPRAAVEALAIAVRAAPWHVTGYGALTLLTGAFPVVVAWCTKGLLDQITQPAPDAAAATRLVVLLALVGVAAAAAPSLTLYLSAQARRTIALVAEDRLHRKINEFAGLARFENPAFLDRLRTARLAGPRAPAQLVDSVVGVTRAVVTVGGFTLSVWIISPVFTLVVVAAAVPVLVAEISLARHRADTQHGIGAFQRRESFYGSLLSTVQAAKEVRLFGLGDHFRSLMLGERRSANAAERVVERRTVFVQSTLAVLAAAVAGAGLLWIVRAAVRGEVTVGEVTLFVASAAAVQTGLAGVAITIAMAHQALVEFEHYRVVLRTGSDLPVPAHPRALPALGARIEFRDVWFRYAEDLPWVLRGLNLTVEAGRSVGIVGVNGAGKSTLVKLLCRFYDPVEGSITWDGVDIRDVAPDELRRRIGAVFQDYMEYDLTVADNIGVGDLTAAGDRGRIREAAERAEINGTLEELPNGYDTMLSRIFADPSNPSAGVLLSGGQWQRIALARSYLRSNPDLLVLDEPSAGLDPEAESRVHERLSSHRSSCTRVLISHRLGTLRDADQIVVLSDGVIVERGTHDELMEGKGDYRRLFQLQAKGYRAETPAEPVYGV
ncbi:multidrug ABC transporter permease [Lentzea aerocolonigenes]|uniref:Multidrug ABC transporter permease n=1 Tax=Lentzea aerocolonigenes TaxID=68170 RepID=A0A0F0H5V1_LENAE|nr:ABC transporter ATP-binding protein [Lentzea aerocolonigenes]KJK51099.1 multidrug ABC transporter permease [Lentzea aerocolonigenes]